MRVRIEERLRFKVQGSRFKVQSSRFKVQGSRFKVQSSRFKVQSSRFKAKATAAFRSGDAGYPGWTLNSGIPFFTLNFEP
jgi:hypothetical protein